jgi:hypothetical protein
LSGGDTANHGRGHSQQLRRELSKRAHAADGEGEQLVIGERVDDASRQGAMTLPVFERV